jgi:hypothetical protein
MMIEQVLPWHALNTAFSEVIERDRHLHSLVCNIIIAVAKKHHLKQIIHTFLDVKQT